jgi:hypothetical protein
MWPLLYFVRRPADSRLREAGLGRAAASRILHKSG